ncbi:MAG: homoserine O-acetyltransferase [Gammaproteobacteria bacterium]
MTGATQLVTINKPLQMRRGGQLPEFTVAIETWGELVGNGENAVLLFTGLSPSAHAASSEADPEPGWWEAMVGPGRPIDTNRFHVICVNSLGSCFGSSGPASVKPATGRHWGMDFPLLSIEDIAAAAKMALDECGLKCLHSVVGPSMGGMSALAFALMFPGFARNFVGLSSATAARPFAIAIRSLQRELIRSDPAWGDGNYAADAQPVAGMRLARKIGMMSYRSAEEWAQRFGRERIPEKNRSTQQFTAEFQVESYLAAHADKFVGGFDANCYLYLSRSMDWFDCAEHGDSVGNVLANLDVESALIIGAETDFLFPIDQQAELASGIGSGCANMEFIRLPSIEGHDSFLVDIDRFGPAVAGYFSKLD